MAKPAGGGTALGSVVDTTQLIEWEQVFEDQPEIFSQLPSDAFIAAIQISELAVGALLANTERRRDVRQQFLRILLSRLTVIPFAELEAREHARLFMAMRNVREFSLVPGLTVLSPG